jgi:hypothetical protein
MIVMLKHNYRLARNYQFADAVVTVVDDKHRGNVGYVLHMLHQKQLYGVVKYIVDGDRVAWLESEIHFNTDEQLAEKWMKETLDAVGLGTLPKEETTYLFDPLHAVAIRYFELDLHNYTVIVHGYNWNRSFTFKTVEELRDYLHMVDQVTCKFEGID